MRYFFKELVSRAFLLPNGKQLAFTHVVDEKGLVEVGDDNPELLAGMLASVGKSGIYETTKEKAEELKKKSSSPKPDTSFPRLRLHEQRDDPFSKPQLQNPQTTILTQPVPVRIVTAQENAKPAVAESPAEPVKAQAGSPPPEHSFKPRTGKAKSKK